MTEYEILRERVEAVRDFLATMPKGALVDAGEIGRALSACIDAPVGMAQRAVEDAVRDTT